MARGRNVSRNDRPSEPASNREETMRKSMRHRLFATCNCCPEPQFSASGISRRDLLAGGAALGVTAAAGGLAMPAFAQAKPHRIDVHHHIVPPTWFAAMEVIGRSDFPLK